MKTKDPLESWDHGAEITCVCFVKIFISIIAITLFVS